MRKIFPLKLHVLRVFRWRDAIAAYLERGTPASP
jgi:hypothetical protein